MRMVKKIISWLSYFLISLLFGAMIYILVGPVPAPLTSQELTVKIDGLFQTAAVWVPHLDIDKGRVRQAYLPLFEKVERGQVLTPSESQEYRQLYQGLLLENQKSFKRFDSQLFAVSDFDMNEENNLGGLGIEGHHDHHDQSSRNNFKEIERCLEWLKLNSAGKYGFSFSRIQCAIFVYKDLNDILFHLATVPHTKSIHYHPLSDVSSQNQKVFESTLYQFKLAQFQNVNDEVFSLHVSKAIADYHELVELVQSLVHNNLSSYELKVVGQWGGWQSLTPNISEKVK